MSEPTVTVVITSIPPRKKLLARAVASVHAQTVPPDRIIVAVDHDREGPSVLRNRSFEQADTEWVALLDDDDEFYPHHLETLLAHRAGADLVYPWFDVKGPSGKVENWRDPLKLDGRSPFGRTFDDRAKQAILRRDNFVPITCLVRVDMMLSVGGFPLANTPEWPHDRSVDMGGWQRLLRAGAWFRHAPERTWAWHHHGKNTSGQVNRW